MLKFIGASLRTHLKLTSRMELKFAIFNIRFENGIRNLHLPVSWLRADVTLCNFTCNASHCAVARQVFKRSCQVQWLLQLENVAAIIAAPKSTLCDNKGPVIIYRLGDRRILITRNFGSVLVCILYSNSSFGDRCLPIGSLQSNMHAILTHLLKFNSCFVQLVQTCNWTLTQQIEIKIYQE